MNNISSKAIGLLKKSIIFFALYIVAPILFGAGVTFAALTLQATSIDSDSTLGVGATTATTVTIGRIGQIVSFPGEGLFSGSSLSIASAGTSTALVFIQGAKVASTSLAILGFTNQTANLLRIASSTGTDYFTVSPIGVASSTELRSPSGTIATLTATTVSSTDVTFLNATSTGSLLVGTLTTNGVASTSQLYFASSTAYGTSTMVSTLVLGSSGTAVQCMQTYVKGTTTLFYVGVNTSTYTMFATSTKPSDSCN
ncbi:MAG: hypothetical protein A3B25_00915 [Candidatus Ryanbacteria bacterium RIFCSPLOWO2_01_FULL_48_26]|uniref:Uncharacterized protein n=1 Tax=Candidatus Ryanbacteria bacterium RIFCSPLOWO2_01_FULL_48_26 TaxID=1802126 RepID=A0A1G2GRC6_9BACT|nr:MAG: hypothetical protein A3B25_00915 [Candidatus Ryanbacteria bacterium RIFCSPLOWO2_01_FULL_48_26]